jgi:hypothetical protein
MLSKNEERKFFNFLNSSHVDPNGIPVNPKGLSLLMARC